MFTSSHFLFQDAGIVMAVLYVVYGGWAATLLGLFLGHSVKQADPKLGARLMALSLAPLGVFAILLVLAVTAGEVVGGNAAQGAVVAIFGASVVAGPVLSFLCLKFPSFRRRLSSRGPQHA